jgi:hypothetical protein
MWQDAAQAVFLQDIKERKRYANLARWHWQLSYAIDRADAQQLDPNALLDILRQVNGELVRTGWSMLHIFDMADAKPFFQTDPSSGMGHADFLECRLIQDERPDPVSPELFPDMWRVSRDGKATLIRNYWEDAANWNSHFRPQPGTWLSPNILVRSLAEFVRHARGLAERFSEL